MNLLNIDPDSAKNLLSGSVIFKVRGSVSATGGHLPEKIFRDKLELMGLEAGVDYNLADVIVGEEIIVEQGETKPKTRAYDFVFPFETEGWERHLFFQSQFYAGDSGSISHKVIDQTSASRNFTRNKLEGERASGTKNIKFIEYLDGAGYFASLRTDLHHMQL